jgi:hypothetical protein
MVRSLGKKLWFSLGQFDVVPVIQLPEIEEENLPPDRVLDVHSDGRPDKKASESKYKKRTCDHGNPPSSSYR